LPRLVDAVDPKRTSVSWTADLRTTTLTALASGV
jgi:hypothetical protein